MFQRKQRGGGKKKKETSIVELEICQMDGSFFLKDVFFAAAELQK